MMRRNAISLVTVFVAGFSVVTAQTAAGPPQQSVRFGPHDGRIYTAGDLQCEVVFAPQRVEVFVRDREGQPVDIRAARGRMTLSLPRNPRRYRYDLYPLSGRREAGQALGVTIDLSGVPARTATAEFALYGIAQQTVSFAAKFRRARSQAQLAINQQRVCPVSGKRLGAVGQPAKVRIGERDVYVCGEGCIKSVQAKPQYYISKVASLKSAALRTRR